VPAFLAGVSRSAAGEGGHRGTNPNPVEAGEWLIPAYATESEPGAPQPGHVYTFNGSSWTSIADCREQTRWKVGAEFNTDPVLIDFIGEPSLQGLTKTEPPAPPVVVPPIVVSARQIRMALSRLGLRAAVENYVGAADQDTKDSWQFAAEFSRDHSMIATAAAVLGKTPADVDALFELAKTL
jgi:hypothetical protein